jgi:molybdopterin molybdotransferase
MAQLSDDCFAFGGALMPIEAAIALITQRVQPVGRIERAALTQADGRVLAADLVAPLSLPPFTNSAVDGYAVRHADLSSGGETRLPLVGRIEAGASAGVLAARACARVFTGAAMPQGADTVFMQEDVSVEGVDIRLPAGLRKGANVRPVGEDVMAGSIALPAGSRLRPQDVSLAAAMGAAHLDVRARPRVAVFSTGNELVSPGEPQAPPQIYDSNRFMLIALLGRLGCEAHDLGILRDEPQSLARALREAAQSFDLIVTSGGVSTGEADHVKTAVESVGSLVLWRMAIKPGRPVAMGVIGGTPFVGLPGNPAASFVTQAYVVRPLALALMGARAREPRAIPVRAAFAYRKKTGRLEFVRVTIATADDGTLDAQKFPREGAGLITSLTQTDGLVVLPEDVTRIEPGETVAFIGYEQLL